MISGLGIQPIGVDLFLGAKICFRTPFWNAQKTPDFQYVYPTIVVLKGSKGIGIIMTKNNNDYGAAVGVALRGEPHQIIIPVLSALYVFILCIGLVSVPVKSGGWLSYPR